MQLERKENKQLQKVNVDLHLENEQLKLCLQQISYEITRNSVNVSDYISEDMIKVISNAETLTPFMQLFWQQQKKLFSTAKTGRRFHPMVIRYCLSLAMKSPLSHTGPTMSANTGISRGDCMMGRMG